MLKLSPATLDWALNHVSVYGDTNLMPFPFEFGAIKDRWAEVRPYLCGSDVTNWSVRAYNRTLAPKNRFGFRSVIQLDPYDFFIYTGLVYEVGTEIEAHRLPASTGIGFSHRFAPDTTGRLFDPSFDWPRFQKRSRELCASQGVSHVVVADIADFFPRLYSHPLENALVDALPGKRIYANSIKAFLKQLNQNVSYGIPTGPEASFLLSELFLDIIDRGLLSEGAIHCRWADDFRIFCSSERDAYLKLNLLANLLFETSGLTLQQSKTRIFTSDDFLKSTERESDREVNRLSEQFDELLSELGIHANFYEPIYLESLDDEQLAKLNTLNLIEILEEQIESDTGFSQPIVRFVMWRLGQLGNPRCNRSTCKAA